MNRKKRIVLICSSLSILITLAIVFLIIFNRGDAIPSNQNLVNLNRVGELPDESLNITFQPGEVVSEYGGVWLFASSDLSIVDFNSISLETLQDIIYIEIGNTSTIDDVNLMLKVFYNYEEVPFQIMGSDMYVTEFLFLAPAGYDMIIPIKLDGNLEANDTINKLTIGTFWEPEYYAMLFDHLEVENNFFDDAGIVLDFEINYGTLGDLDLPVVTVDPGVLIEDLMFHSLMINDDFELEAGADAAMNPPQPWQARAGEEVEMSFVTNPHGIIFEEIEEYLIIAMLDWHQIPLNGQPYLLVNSVGTGQQGFFTITAPDEPGLYEFVAFLVLNPRNLRSADNFFPHEIAMRFTLEVTE